MDIELIHNTAQFLGWKMVRANQTIQTDSAQQLPDP
jgi:hypothetical protein